MGIPKWWLWTWWLAAALTDDHELCYDLTDEAIALQGGDIVLSTWFLPEEL